jgi:hypothetical protein
MSDFADRFRPLNDVVLVKVGPLQKFSDIIEIPDSIAQNHPVSVGVIVKAGPGRWKAKKAGEPKRVFIPTASRPGQHVVFFSAAMHGKKGESFCHDMPDDHALIRDGDVLFEYDEDVKVDV